MVPLRLLLVALAVLLSACAPVPTGTPMPLPEISGVLQGETVLSGEVVLAADVLVPSGAALIIEPGTTVYVRPSESTKIDPEYLSPATELLVRGSLRIAGSPRHPVSFLPIEQAEGEDVAWAGIILDRAEDSAIVGARIERAENGILCIASSPLVRDSRLRGCRYGLVAQQGSAPAVRFNQITGGEGGVFCWWGSNPLLEGNRIAGHEEEGVFVDRTSRPRLEGNAVTGNAIGLALFPRDLSFDSALVTGNGEDVRLLGTEGRAGE